MPEFNFENLFKISLPLLIVLAILKITTYYYYFNVPIVQYLEITEIVTLFLDDIASYLFLLSIPFFFLPHLPTTKWSSFFCLIICAIIAAVNKGGAYYKVYLALCLPLIFLLPLLQLKLNKWILAIMLYSFALLISTLVGLLQAQGVYTAYYYSEVEVTIDNTVIKSDSLFYYLGKTKNYVFFYDAVNEGPVIYPSAEVNKIVFKSKIVQNCMPVFP